MLASKEISMYSCSFLLRTYGPGQTRYFDKSHELASLRDHLSLLRGVAESTDILQRNLHMGQSI